MDISEVKRAMVLRQTVRYNETDYTVDGCTLKYDHKGQGWYYLLELLDRTGNSIMTVPMQYVAVVSDKNTGYEGTIEKRYERR